MAGVAGVLLEQVAQQAPQPRVVAVAVVDVGDEVEPALGESLVDPAVLRPTASSKTAYVSAAVRASTPASNSHSSVPSWPSDRQGSTSSSPRSFVVR